MDPITQGALGATASLLTSNKAQLNNAKDKLNVTLAGCLGGLAADLDIIIRSASDPLLAIEFHRHFSHSLFFIPIGGLLVALFLWATFFKSTPFKQTYFYATVGYATHALLDSCTTYGTQLLLPFSDVRIAWDVISVVDPLVTLPLLIAVIITYKSGQTKWLKLSAVLVVLYMSFGVLQHHRAIEVTKKIAKEKSHCTTRVKAMPTLGKLLTWRSLYQCNDRYYLNGVKIDIWGNATIIPGQSVPKLDTEKHFPQLDKDSVQYADISRFNKFSDNWLMVDPKLPTRIGDVRYAMYAQSISPLWSIEIDVSQQDKHVRYLNNTNKRMTWDNISSLLGQ